MATRESNWELIEGDVFAELPELKGSFDACFCDPPYLLGFMGREFDIQHKLREGANDGQRIQAWNLDWISLAFPLLKPGGRIVAASGSRVYHRLASAAEDAGFEIGPMFAWINGQAMAQGLDISKAIDKAAGEEREVVGSKFGLPGYEVSAPATDAARLFHGYNTRLKDALCPWLMAHRPVAGSWAQNAVEHGVAGLNVDAGRVPTDSRPKKEHTGRDGKVYGSGLEGSRSAGYTQLGRHPPNVALDLESAEEIGRQSGFTEDRPGTKFRTADYQAEGRITYHQGGAGATSGYNTSGGANRFFHSFRYHAKAGPEERIRGCEGFLWRVSRDHPLGFERIDFDAWQALPERERYQGSIHPTVKPIELCRHLARLILPPPRDTPRRLLVPFAGTGSEMIGALLAGWDEVCGIEMEPTYCEISKQRIPAWGPYTPGRANVIAEAGGIASAKDHHGQQVLDLDLP